MVGSPVSGPIPDWGGRPGPVVAGVRKVFAGHEGVELCGEQEPMLRDVAVGGADGFIVKAAQGHGLGGGGAAAPCAICSSHSPHLDKC